MYRALLALVLLCLTCNDPPSGSRSGKCSPTPRSCPNGWCWDYSMPPQMTPNAIWGTDCNNVWIVGGGQQYKVILQWNGVAWTVRNHSSPEILYGVWGIDEKSAWAVGAKGTILAWDGIAWLPRSSGTFADLLAVGGTDANNVWAVGKSGTILSWDGTSWSSHTSGTAVSLNAVWGSDEKNVWAVGDGGTILSWDGTSWSPQASGTTGTLRGIWGSDAGNVWAVGRDGIFKRNGTSWARQGCIGCGGEMWSVWGESASSAWAYSSGTLLRWNGTEWSAESLPPNVSVSRAWGADADHMWGIASGVDGGDSIFMKNSSGWIKQRERWGADLKVVHGADANNVYAAGTNRNILRPNAVMVRWDGKSWNSINTMHGTVSALFAASPTSVWVSGGRGTIVLLPEVYMWDGTQWAERVPSIFERDYPPVMGGSGDKDVLIPTSKSLYRWDGAMFMESPPIGEFTAIWTYDANNIWGLAGSVTAIRGRGPITLGSSVPGGVAMWGTSLDDVWVVGMGGVIYHCATAQPCVQQPSGTTKNLRGVWAASATEAWAVGDAGTIVQWDGKTWTPLFTGIDLDLSAIWGTSGTNVYIAGQYGIILHKGS